MRIVFPNTYDRADLLMSAGCSTFVAASLVVVLPRVGTVLMEILLGMFLIGCAIVARARIRRKVQLNGMAAAIDKSGRKGLDRYDVLALLGVVVIQSVLDGLLHRLGWSEGTRRVVPLMLLGFAILLKPRLMESARRRRQSKQVVASASPEPHCTTAPIPIVDAETQSEVCAGAPRLEERK
jgi:hypothetical protein